MPESAVFRSVKNNFWNLFSSCLGVLATLYFSLFYVPDYIQQITNSKITEIHISLIDTIQEFIFNEKQIDIDAIQNIIKGKELKFGVKYPFSAYELLVQVQEDFVQNKFIDLDTRKKYLTQ